MKIYWNGQPNYPRQRTGLTPPLYSWLGLSNNVFIPYKIQNNDFNISIINVNIIDLLICHELMAILIILFLWPINQEFNSFIGNYNFVYILMDRFCTCNAKVIEFSSFYWLPSKYRKGRRSIMFKSIICKVID